MVRIAVAAMALLLGGLLPGQTLEQELVRKFSPSFLVSPHDCAGVPAEFDPLSPEPKPLFANGAIYTQILRVVPNGKTGAYFEIHYHHLWSRDCGRIGHPLDAEHVSVLVHAAGLSQPVDQWKAAYWLAAAHEDTICDSSHAIAAASLSAIEHGAAVWVSKDKHASFLDRGLCSGGCGRDQCEGNQPLAGPKLIPLDTSAEWTRDPRWPLATRFQPEFSDALISRLDAAAGLAVANSQSRRQIKAVVRVSDTTSTAMMLGPQHANKALQTADQKTDHALRKSAGAVDRSLRKSHRAVTGWLSKRM